jgi:hypothetical protein
MEWDFLTLRSLYNPPSSYRYLDPDPTLLSDEVNATTNPKFHALNEAVVQLVRPAFLRIIS